MVVTVRDERSRILELALGSINEAVPRLKILEERLQVYEDKMAEHDRRAEEIRSELMDRYAVSMHTSY